MGDSCQKRADLGGLERMNILLFIAIFVLLKMLLAYVTDVIHIETTDKSIMSGFEEIGSVYFTFLAVVLFGPLLETYLVQYLFFRYLLDYLNPWKIVLLSALVFAALHHYSVGYVLYAFVSGILLSTSYALRLRSNPFLCTLTIHSIYNLVGFIYNRW